MKKPFSLLFFLFLITQVQTQTVLFDSLLNTHVDDLGNVDYINFKKDEAKLDSYLTYLASTKPEKNWSDNKTKAFWLNVYNAYTIKLILENYPLKSITLIKQKGKDAWNIPFVHVGGKIHTLNTVEHIILRKQFNDPRIHVGVNCASVSCPLLGNFAFTEKNVDVKLDHLMKGFINDKKRNNITKKNLQLSKIFDWFQEDFTKSGSLIEYLNQFSNIKINKKANVRFLEYNWSLNKI